MKQTRHVIKLSFAIMLLFTMGFGLFWLYTPETKATPQTTTITLSGSKINFADLATADFNGDGYKEIVAAGSDGMLYVVSSSDGISWNVVWSYQPNNDLLAANPPTAKTSNTIQSSPAIADLDNDGHLDIVIAMGGDVHEPDINNHYNGGVLVYRYDSAWNFSLIETLSGDGLSGWPQPRIDQVGWPPPGYSNADGFWDGIRTTPALGDLDGDGDLEIIVEGIDRRIHAWHHDGTKVDGWPLYSGNGDAMTRGGLSSPAMGDIDNDGLAEMVVGTMNTNNNTVWAVNGDSSNVTGWPVKAQNLIMSSPALGDVDGDGFLEIVHTSGWGTSGATNLVYIWNHDGTPLTGWPQATAGIVVAPPALGDIDNDGDLEIVVGCGWHVDNSCNLLYAWNPDGSLVPGFPVAPKSPNPWIPGSYTMPYSPILADFDGDNTVEIMVAHKGAWGITIVEPNGTVSDFTTYTLPGGLDAPPIVDDIDNDGFVEILAGGDDQASGKGIIQIWDANGSAMGELPWPASRQNMRRDGLAPQISDITGTIREPDGTPLSGVTVTLNTGDNQLTGADGTFAFLDLPPGDYEITPTFGNYTFSPDSRTVSISPDAHNQDFEIIYYSIMGTTYGSNGKSLANVTINLSGGANTNTDATGNYSFIKLSPGNYTITPTVASGVATPATRMVTLPPSANNQNFHILPNSVSTVLNAGTPDELTYVDTQGLTTTITFPAGAVTQSTTIVLTPTLPHGSAFFGIDGSMGSLEPGRMAFVPAGHSFDMEAYQGGVLIPDFVFSAPVSVTIMYSDVDIRVISSPNQLYLLWEAPGGWEEVAETCSPRSSINRDTANRIYETAICHLSNFSLFGPTHQLYLPLVLK